MTTTSSITDEVNFASIAASSVASNSSSQGFPSTRKTTMNGNAEKKSFKSVNVPIANPSEVSTTPIPEASNGTEAPRRPNPLNVAYDQKVNELDAKVNNLKRKLDALKNDAYGSNEGNQETRNTRNSLRVQLRDLNAKLDAVEENKKKLQSDLSNLKEVHAKQLETTQAAKDKLPIKSFEEVDRQINRLETSIEQGGMTLKDEKNALQEISKLRKNRKALEAFESGKAVGIDPAIALRTKVDLLKDRLDDKWAESKDIRKEISIVKDSLKALDGNKEEAEKRQMERENQISQLKTQLDAVYTEKRQAYEDFRKKKAERVAAYERNQSKREEQRQRYELEDQLDALYTKLRSIDPKTTADQQLSECVNVSNYFTQLISSSTDSVEKHSTPTSEPQLNVRKPDAPSSDEWTAIKPKAHKEDVYYVTPISNSAKSKKVSSATSGDDRTLTHKHPIQILAALSDLGFTIPQDSTQVKDLLAQLGHRRELIEGSRDKALESVHAKQQEVQMEIDALQIKLESLSTSKKMSGSNSLSSINDVDSKKLQQEQEEETAEL